jgi:endoglycosylceramidase
MLLSVGLLSLAISEIKALPSSITGRFIPTINADTNMMIDADGRERFFHGTNIVYKAAPYHPSLQSFNSETSFCDEDMDLLRSMGHNSIRLSVPW